MATCSTLVQVTQRGRLGDDDPPPDPRLDLAEADLEFEGGDGRGRAPGCGRLLSGRQDGARQVDGGLRRLLAVPPPAAAENAEPVEDDPGVAVGAEGLVAAERLTRATVGPAQHPQPLGDQLVGLRGAAGKRDQPQDPRLPFGIAASERQPGGDVLPQTDRVAAQASTSCGCPKLAAVDADQTELAGRLAEFGDRDGEVLAIALPDPVGAPAEMLHRLFYEGGREVTGTGELHPVAEPFEEPPVGLDHIGPGGGLIGAVELRPGDQCQQLRSTRGAQPTDDLGDVGPHVPSLPRRRRVQSQSREKCFSSRGWSSQAASAARRRPRPAAVRGHRRAFSSSSPA